MRSAPRSISYDDPGFIDTPYLVRESGVSDPEPDFTNPTEVAANLYGDEDVDWEETTGARAALRWQPGDNVDATFTYHYQNMEVGGRTQNHVAAFGTGQLRIGDALSRAERAAQRAAVGRDRRRPRLRAS